MKIADSVKLAQTNLLRSKLRTSLTIIAVFIGALTISLTNGVSNGVKAYIDDQLGNIGAEDTLIIQAKMDESAAGFGSDKVSEYDPNKNTGAFNIATLNNRDVEKIAEVEGLSQVSPELMPTVEYVTRGGKKYTTAIQEYPAGLKVQLSAGRTVKTEAPDQVMIPTNYLDPLGFDSAQAAIGKLVTFGIKNPSSQIQEITATIVGVQQKTILGSGGWYISRGLAKELHQIQTANIESLANNYLGATAKFPSNYSPEQIEALKKRVDKAGYAAMTLQDQIGIVKQIIDTIQIALNIFGGIALLAASFGIVNTLLMAVNERTREIGLMKALGSSRRSIFSIFSIEAISLGFWGSLLGVLASMGIGAIVNPIAADTFLKDFEGFHLLAFPPLPSIGIIGLIMLISFIAGALPSLKASRLNPIEALRYE